MATKTQADWTRAFKEADIRGKYPKEIDDELAYLVARAFVSEYGYERVVVAYDMRESTPALHEAFVHGVVDAGADVLDIGMVHSPLMYFVSATEELPGVMITASHSPRQYNGFKLVHPGAIPLTEKSGLGAIKKRIEKQRFTEPQKRGKVKQKDYKTAYQRFVVAQIKKSQSKGLQVVADIGNGMASCLIPLLDDKLPVEFIYLFPEPDGTFPNRGSDPTLKKHQKQLAAELKAGAYDFGISFDGDADRIAFLDERGRFVNSAVIGAIIARHLLKKYPGEKHVFTNLTSRVYEETIREHGGKPVRARVGHSFIKETMRKQDVRFGCEHSGHYYFKDYFYTDSVTLTLLLVLEAFGPARATGQTFSEFVAPLQRYHQLEDVVIDVTDKAAALGEVEAYLRNVDPVKLTKFDGFFVDFGDVWGAVKPSVTEHALKVMFEGTNRKTVREQQAEIVRFIKGVAAAQEA